jgi:hypothetical protein
VIASFAGPVPRVNCRVYPRRKPREGSGDRIGRWLDEKIDLASVYAEIWKDAAPAHLVDVAVFCDSDDHAHREYQLLRICQAGTTVRLGQRVPANASRPARS